MPEETVPNPFMTALQQWTAFAEAVPPENKEAIGLYVGPLSLLNDARIAYYAGAYGAAVVMCRAAIEGACFVALCSVRMQPGMYGNPWPRTLSGDYRKPLLSEIMQAVRAKKMLDEALLKDVRVLVEDRADYIAHLESKKAGELMKSAAQPPASGETWIRTWVTQDEARRDIQTAQDVILALIKWNSSQPVQS